MKGPLGSFSLKTSTQNFMCEPFAPGDFSLCFQTYIIQSIPKFILLVFGIPSLIKLGYRPSFAVPLGLSYYLKIVVSFDSGYSGITGYSRNGGSDIAA
jgi:hypothetical protein